MLLLLLSFLLLLRKLLHSGLFWLLRKGFEVLKLMLIEMVLHVMRSQVRRRCKLHEGINGSLHLNCNWSLHLNCRLIHVRKTRSESWQWIVVLKNLVLHMGYEWMLNRIRYWSFDTDTSPDSSILLKLRPRHRNVIMLFQSVVKS